MLLMKELENGTSKFLKDEYDPSQKVSYRYILVFYRLKSPLRNQQQHISEPPVKKFKLCTQEKAIQVDLSVSKSMVDKGTQTYDVPRTLTVTDFIKTNAHLSSFCGLNTLEGFEKIAALIDEVLVQTQYGVVFVLDTREMLTLCLMKLKTGLPFSFLAPLFSISKKTCIKYFKIMIDIMYLITKNLIRWPTRREIMNTTPQCFHNYPNTRVILDCSEVYIEKLNCIDCRVKTYSFYYSGQTLKFLVGIASSGKIIFISRAYGGRASDKFITNDSGLLDLLEENDGVMVDKGFQIEEEVADRGCKIIQPPFLKDRDKFTPREGIENVDVARVRVHVERAIQRIKVFKILSTDLPRNLLHEADKILVVICGLVNLQSPIIADNDNFNKNDAD